MPELPDHLDIAVALDGRPLAGAWVELRLPMERKRDYGLIVGPTDATGALAVSRAELENQISVIQLSAFMDYSSLGVWRGEMVLRPFDAAAITRAQARHQDWAAELFAAYPGDFDAEMASLAGQLAATPGLALTVSARAEGGSARLTCVAAST